MNHFYNVNIFLGTFQLFINFKVLVSYKIYGKEYA